MFIFLRKLGMYIFTLFAINKKGCNLILLLAVYQSIPAIKEWLVVYSVICQAYLLQTLILQTLLLWLSNYFFSGSSAGAGSEVFHVYRHLRRYELTRQQWIEESATNEDKDLHFMMNLAAKKSADEERTAKKRAKRS